jgi:site-specific DNA recombinase
MIKDPNCKNKNWKMDELNNIVFDEIKKLAMDPEYLHSIRAEKKSSSDESKNKIDIIEHEIEKIDEQISRFMDLYGIGKFTIDQVSSKVDPLNETRRNLQKELDSLNASAGRISEEEALEILATFEEELEMGDFDAIRRIIEQLIYYIELDNDDVYIHWKFA